MDMLPFSDSENGQDTENDENMEPYNARVPLSEAFE